MRVSISSIGDCYLNDTRKAMGAVHTLNPNTPLEEIPLFWTRAACTNKRLNEEVNCDIPCLGRKEKVKGVNSPRG